MSGPPGFGAALALWVEMGAGLGRSGDGGDIRERRVRGTALK